MILCFCFGAIAQLGERLHGMQEVASSNLVGSIVVSGDEFAAYEYSTCVEAVGTLIKKAVNYSN